MMKKTFYFLLLLSIPGALFAVGNSNNEKYILNDYDSASSSQLNNYNPQDSLFEKATKKAKISSQKVHFSKDTGIWVDETIWKKARNSLGKRYMQSTDNQVKRIDRNTHKMLYAAAQGTEFFSSQAKPIKDEEDKSKLLAFLHAQADFNNHFYLYTGRLGEKLNIIKQLLTNKKGKTKGNFNQCYSSYRAKKIDSQIWEFKLKPNLSMQEHAIKQSTNFCINLLKHIPISHSISKDFKPTKPTSCTNLDKTLFSKYELPPLENKVYEDIFLENYEDIFSGKVSVIKF